MTQRPHYFSREDLAFLNGLALPRKRVTLVVQGMTWFSDLDAVTAQQNVDELVRLLSERQVIRWGRHVFNPDYVERIEIGEIPPPAEPVPAPRWWQGISPWFWLATGLAVLQVAYMAVSTYRSFAR